MHTLIQEVIFLSYEKNKKNFADIFKKYNYLMRTYQLRKEKIYYRDIQTLLDECLIEKVKQGYYHWLGGSESDEINIINALFPNAVLCMETALFYYGYSDRSPNEWSITIDKNTSRRCTKIDYPFVKTYRVEPFLLPIGKTKGQINNVDVSIYDRDRTICDIIRNVNKIDKEIFNKSIRAYVNDLNKSIPNLMQYAKVLKTQKKVKDLIGVWL